MKKCPKCEAEFAWGESVCPKCGKKVSNPDVKLSLKNQAGEVVTISCKEKITLSAMQTLAAYRFDLPPLNIKPFNFKDLAKCLGLFALIFVAAAFFNVNAALGFVLLIAMVALNLIYTRNFYFNKIKKLIVQGYEPSDDDTRQILQNAGLLAK